MTRTLTTAGLALATLVGVGGCDDMPSPVALIDGVEVVWVQARQPEVAPGETLEITAEVFHPEGEGGELVVWTCARLGPTCAETELGLPIGTYVHVDRDAAFIEDARFPIPDSAGLFLTEENPAATLEVWTMFCAKGVCDLPARVAADPQPGTAAYEALRADLDNPFDLLQGESLDAVSVVVNRVILSTRSGRERNRNPIVQVVDPLPDRVRPGEPVEFTLLTDAIRAWPAATGGTFAFDGYALAGGAVTVRWTPPEEPGDHKVWVLFSDGLGGVAVYRKAKVRVE